MHENCKQECQLRDQILRSFHSLQGWRLHEPHISSRHGFEQSAHVQHICETSQHKAPLVSYSSVMLLEHSP